MRRSGFHALWKTLSGSECAVENAVGNAVSRYMGLPGPGDVSDVVGPEKVGVRTNRLLGPYK